MPEPKTQETKKEPESTAKMVGKKFIAGTFGGLLQACCSAPMDLIKSRVQISGGQLTVRGCIAETLRKEGPLAFYKGIGPPLVVAGSFNATLFASNETAKSFLRWLLHLDADKPMGLQWICVAGVLAAPSSCFVLTPFENVKVQLQLQRENKANAQYKNMLDCARQLWQKEGIRAFSRGYFPTLMTRVLGLPGYFAGAEISGRWYKARYPDHSDFTVGMFKGSCAGFLFWNLCLPADTVKTKVMGQMHNAVKLTPAQIARDVYSQRGILGFYAGYQAVMFRSFPANASVFAGISLAEGWMKTYLGW